MSASAGSLDAYLSSMRDSLVKGNEARNPSPPKSVYVTIEPSYKGLSASRPAAESTWSAASRTPSTYSRAAHVEVEDVTGRPSRYTPRSSSTSSTARRVAAAGLWDGSAARQRRAVGGGHDGESILPAQAMLLRSTRSPTHATVGMGRMSPTSRRNRSPEFIARAVAELPDRHISRSTESSARRQRVSSRSPIRPPLTYGGSSALPHSPEDLQHRIALSNIARQDYTLATTNNSSLIATSGHESPSPVRRRPLDLSSTQPGGFESSSILSSGPTWLREAGSINATTTDGPRWLKSPPRESSEASQFRRALPPPPPPPPEEVGSPVRTDTAVAGLFARAKDQRIFSPSAFVHPDEGSASPERYSSPLRSEVGHMPIPASFVAPSPLVKTSSDEVRSQSEAASLSAHAADVAARDTSVQQPPSPRQPAAGRAAQSALVDSRQHSVAMGSGHYSPTRRTEEELAMQPVVEQGAGTSSRSNSAWALLSPTHPGDLTTHLAGSSDVAVGMSAVHSRIGNVKLSLAARSLDQQEALARHDISRDATITFDRFFLAVDGLMGMDRRAMMRTCSDERQKMFDEFVAVAQYSHAVFTRSRDIVREEADARRALIQRDAAFFKIMRDNQSYINDFWKATIAIVEREEGNRCKLTGECVASLFALQQRFVCEAESIARKLLLTMPLSQIGEQMKLDRLPAEQRRWLDQSLPIAQHRVPVPRDSSVAQSFGGDSARRREAALGAKHDDWASYFTVDVDEPSASSFTSVVSDKSLVMQTQQPLTLVLSEDTAVEVPSVAAYFGTVRPLLGVLFDESANRLLIDGEQESAFDEIIASKSKSAMVYQEGAARSWITAAEALQRHAYISWLRIALRQAAAWRELILSDVEIMTELQERWEVQQKAALEARRMAGLGDSRTLNTTAAAMEQSGATPTKQSLNSSKAMPSPVVTPAPGEVAQHLSHHAPEMETPRLHDGANSVLPSGAATPTASSMHSARHNASMASSGRLSKSYLSAMHVKQGKSSPAASRKPNPPPADPEKVFAAADVQRRGTVELSHSVAALQVHNVIDSSREAMLNASATFAATLGTDISHAARRRMSKTEFYRWFHVVKSAPAAGAVEEDRGHQQHHSSSVMLNDMSPIVANDEDRSGLPPAAPGPRSDSAVHSVMSVSEATDPGMVRAPVPATSPSRLDSRRQLRQAASSGLPPSPRGANRSMAAQSIAESLHTNATAPRSKDEAASRYQELQQQRKSSSMMMRQSGGAPSPGGGQRKWADASAASASVLMPTNPPMTSPPRDRDFDTASGSVLLPTAAAPPPDTMENSGALGASSVSALSSSRAQLFVEGNASAASLSILRHSGGAGTKSALRPATTTPRHGDGRRVNHEDDGVEVSVVADGPNGSAARFSDPELAKRVTPHPNDTVVDIRERRPSEAESSRADQMSDGIAAHRRYVMEERLLTFPKPNAVRGPEVRLRSTAAAAEASSSRPPEFSSSRLGVPRITGSKSITVKRGSISPPRDENAKRVEAEAVAHDRASKLPPSPEKQQLQQSKPSATAPQLSAKHEAQAEALFRRIDPSRSGCVSADAVRFGLRKVGMVLGGFVGDETDEEASKAADKAALWKLMDDVCTPLEVAGELGPNEYEAIRSRDGDVEWVTLPIFRQLLGKLLSTPDDD